MCKEIMLCLLHLVSDTFLSRECNRTFSRLRTFYLNILKCSPIRSVIPGRRYLPILKKFRRFFKNWSFVSVDSLEGLKMEPEIGTFFSSKSVIWPRHTRVCSRIVRTGEWICRFVPTLLPAKSARPFHLDVPKSRAASKPSTPGKSLFPAGKRGKEGHFWESPEISCAMEEGQWRGDFAEEGQAQLRGHTPAEVLLQDVGNKLGWREYASWGRRWRGGTDRDLCWV